MSKLLLKLYDKLNFIPCRCGCRETKVTGQVLMDTYGPVCEYEVRCVNCNEIVNYWAYGYYQFPFTRTEQFSNWCHDTKICLKRQFINLFGARKVVG